MKYLCNALLWFYMLYDRVAFALEIILSEKF